jgi:hypothetical protein
MSSDDSNEADEGFIPLETTNAMGGESGFMPFETNKHGWVLYDVKPSEAVVSGVYLNGGVALTKAVYHAKASLMYHGYRLVMDTPEAKIWQTKDASRSVRLLRMPVLPEPSKPRALLFVRYGRVESDFDLYGDWDQATKTAKQRMEQFVKCPGDVKTRRLGSHEVMWFCESRPAITVHVKDLRIFFDSPK